MNLNTFSHFLFFFNLEKLYRLDLSALWSVELTNKAWHELDCLSPAVMCKYQRISTFFWLLTLKQDSIEGLCFSQPVLLLTRLPLHTQRWVGSRGSQGQPRLQSGITVITRQQSKGNPKLQTKMLRALLGFWFTWVYLCWRWSMSGAGNCLTWGLSPAVGGKEVWPRWSLPMPQPPTGPPAPKPSSAYALAQEGNDFYWT